METQKHWIQLELFAKDPLLDAPLSSRRQRLAASGMPLREPRDSPRVPPADARSLRKLRKKSKPTGPVTFVMATVNDSGLAVGESHPNCRYLDSEVETARDFRAQGYSYSEISRMLDMPIRTIRDYVSGRRRNQSVATWKRVKRHLP